MSIKTITYLNEFYKYEILGISDPYQDRIYSNEIFVIQNFLNKLEDDKIYVVSFEFIYCWGIYDEDDPTIILSKPILICKDSNPEILSKFIEERMGLVFEAYFGLTPLKVEEDTNLALGSTILIKYKDIQI